MSESLAWRAVWAIGVPLLFWAVGFFTLRALHRRDRALRSPETAPWQDDALAAVPLAWLFASRDVLRAVLGRDPSLLLHLAAAIGIAAALTVGLQRVRRAR
ncbi:MAG TPA: hypothetical protein VFE30_11590 [Anaeromyxobacteraceae bacterium]|jgi:hypothetical protein|nr:hypothetical protein [Anaeromyxobacteraceae bacterium]